MQEKIRWGIVGLGKIAGKFAQDLILVEDAEITAVASRSIDKANNFAKMNNAKHAFGSYLELFESDVVDVIYIATPHTSHAELSIQAMQHGKHVLCEKPAGVNTIEVQKMIAVARENKVFFMEALWSRFMPSIQNTIKMIADGEIGAVSHLYSDFAFYALDRDLNGRVLNLKLAGGSLLDIGIYPIFMAYLILGKPKRILATSNFHSNGMEKQTSMIFEYDNAQAVLYSGFTSNSETKTEITGNNGSIILHSRWHETENCTVTKNGETEQIKSPKIGFGYAHEIHEVHQCLRNKKMESELWSHQNSLDLIELLDKVREEAGIVFPFEA